jgi:hypothetical protein
MKWLRYLQSEFLKLFFHGEIFLGVDKRKRL